MTNIVVHALLALVLFFVSNWLGKHSVTSGYHLISLFEKVDEAPAFNFVFRVATPLAFLAIVSALLYGVGLDSWVANIYQVVVFQYVFRWMYLVVAGRVRLLNWPIQLLTASITIACAYGLYRGVLARRGTLLPDAANLRSELWVLVIIYVYTLLNKMPFGHAGAYRRRREYIGRRFRALATAFSRVVCPQTRTSAEEALVYAVMIYETFNRPHVYRAIERWVLGPVGFASSLGPMQVQGANDDVASISAGTVKLLEAYRRALPVCEREAAAWASDENARKRYAQAAAVRAAAREYNVRGDYSDEIEAIYDTLVEDFYPSAKIVSERAAFQETAP